MSFMGIPFSGGGSGGSSGPLRFVDSIDVSVAATSLTFGSGGDGANGTALDGDSDEIYILSHHFADTPSGLDIVVRPNGVTTNLVAARHFGGSSTNSVVYAAWPIMDTGSARTAQGTTYIYAKSGKVRAYNTVNTLGTIPDTISDIFTENYGGLWDDTSTNITSLDIVADVTDGIAVGSRLVLWKLVAG